MRGGGQPLIGGQFQGYFPRVTALLKRGLTVDTLIFCYSSGIARVTGSKGVVTLACQGPPGKVQCEKCTKHAYID